jgi:hypothetical protein
MVVRALCIALVLLLPAVARAQWHLETSLGTLFDDNTFNNSYQIADRITETGLSTGYRWERDRSVIGLAATGGVSYFSIHPSRSFSSFTLNADDRASLDDDGNHSLQATVQFGLRTNHEEYRVYDHRQFVVAASARHYLDGSWTLRETYTFRIASFPALGELNYLEHAAGAQGGITWPSRTTMIARLEFGMKIYAAPAGDGGGTVAPSGGSPAIAAGSPGTSQLLASLKLAQGLSDNTGISLLAQYQATLAKESRYLSFPEGIVSDDDMFDDRYGYDAPFTSVVLTQLLGDDVRCAAALSYQRRQYSVRPALDMDGVSVLALRRIDRRTALSLDSQIDLPFGGMSLSLLYEYIINTSNDPLYMYRNQTFSARLAVPY